MSALVRSPKGAGFTEFWHKFYQTDYYYGMASTIFQNIFSQ